MLKFFTSLLGRSSVEAALSAAEDYLNSDEIAKAEAILARLIDKAPLDSRGRELMGRVLTIRATKAEERGDLHAAAEARSQAYEHYLAAVEMNPDSAGLQQSAGVIAMMAGESNAALVHFESAASLDPTNPQHPLYAAQLLIGQDRLEEARESLKATLRLDPDEPIAYASLAIIALQQQQFELALSHIAEAREIAPDDTRFRVQEAKIHRRIGDPARATELLIALSAAERAEAGVTFELASSFSDLGQHTRVAEVWMNRHRHQQGDANAYKSAVRAGAAFLLAGRPDEAIRWLETAKLIAPTSPEVIALELAIAEDTASNR